MSTQPLFVPPESPKQDLHVVGEVIHTLADAKTTGSYEVFEQQGPVGSGPPPHHHPWDEAYFMLEGEMDVLLGDRWIVLKPGAFVHVPRGVPHCFRYRTPGRFVSMTSEGGASQFFTELAREVPPGPPDLAQVVAIAGRNRVQLAAPPA